jgi:protein-S-isoprenylcysteine O-methyltransferase Ste14
MMPLDARKRPNVVPWPPVILFLLAAAAFAINAIIPTPPRTPDSMIWLRIAGTTVCAAGIALDLWAVLTMFQHRTNILPHRAADRLVTAGPFGFSRNPIYLGNTTLLVGLAIVLANPVFLIAAYLNVVLVNKLAIEREEAHLASRFKEAWRAYAARVPRWIGPIKRSRSTG